MPNSGKKTPLAAGEANVYVQQVTGSVGNCVGIPAEATAVSMNVTIVSPTAQSNLRIFPANVPTPTASNLNWLAGQSPTPNKVDVKLSDDGKIKLYNHAGTVNVLADVVGYYIDSSLKELAARLDVLEASEPFTVIAEGSGITALDGDLQSVLGIQVTAPVDGQVTILSTVGVQAPNAGDDVVCIIQTEADTSTVSTTTPYVQWFEAAASANDGSLAGSRPFDMAAGETTTYQLKCRENTGIAGETESPTLTAIFTPTP